jgi:uncharacterized protein
MKRFLLFFTLLIFLLFNFACGVESVNESAPVISTEKPPIREIESPAVKALMESALEQTKVTRGYTQDYYVIPYPMGDVPAETGACTDVVIRAFRKAGVDLQREVHEDMRANFSVYPKKWGLPKPDTNIDHRRVPNLQTFFTRKGKALSSIFAGGNLQTGRRCDVGHRRQGNDAHRLGFKPLERNSEPLSDNPQHRRRHEHR